MSRFAEIAEEISGSELNRELIPSTLKKIRERLKTIFVRVEFSFILFLKKKSPVSQKEGSMNYNCKIVGELGEDNKLWNYFEVEVPTATLCPCSKEISDFGAHNQRANVVLRVKSSEYISLKEMIRVVEERASSDLFSILKRVDEKFMTEKMYENPKFVEDIVRDVTLWAKSDTRITDFIVKCKSFESIHNHNAYAIIINDEKNANN
ncbi:GTP cyclohydrolase I FolE2 [Candidatus Falkowbacteria bacterium CG10_big_fil_rev_8_21_14_0_10_43_10]|uniref:GTP cyclohydrolase I FolE2 n=1 Tax=Candidatus Falkowbacteria bacterium CG10_big_fil_rev_8_21_14_0_10_43_10 TaxID=1974567 RepID=A0A2H0V181_9BACT|nr:MAG: GTP cyclohydrolase I FolE2 [Candidatus Falkowbacteria bacterium CG10_big_fil_rev_8_21_14_0_10_43_10]